MLTPGQSKWMGTPWGDGALGSSADSVVCIEMTLLVYHTLLRSMKRVWEGQGQGGLLKRRDKEAELFEEGLKCDCWE